MTMRLSALLGALLFGPALAVAQINPDDLLPVERAFALDGAVSGDSQRVRLTWQIADGYYLYRHAFRIEPVSEGLVLGEPRIPDGKSYSDEFFGDVQIYRDRVEISVPVEQWPDDGDVALQAAFQGCADLGVCYPPHRVEVALGRPVATPEPAATLPSGGDGGVLDRLGLNQADGALTGRGAPLPPEQAFGFETIALDAGTLLARFRVHDGYYLYRHTIEFEAPDPAIEVTGLQLPEAEPITDEFFGDTRVYFDEVEIPITLARPAGGEQTLELVARFQGCQIDGICYPPMTRTLAVDLPAADRAIAAAAPTSEDAAAEPPPGTAAQSAPALPESEQDRLARFIAEQPLALTLALFVLLGIGLAFTPCVFPMIPILSGIIAGEGDGVTRGKAFSLSLAYVLAMAATYTVVGVIAALAGYNLQIFFQNPWVLSTFAAIFVLLALAMFGFYNLQMPASLQAKLTEISNRQSGGSLIGAGIMGFLSALIVGPCVTAPLIGILIFISQTGDAVLGGSVLFALSIGMGVPLLAIGVGLGHWLPRAGGWMDAVKAVFGVGLLALAIWMLERIVPGAVTMLLWGLLLVGSGVFLGALTRLDRDAGGWPRLWQALGVVLLTLGIAQFIGAAAGGNDWLRPLAPLAGGGAGAATTTARAEFARVDNLEQIERAVATSDRPVMLDFYADWCISCKEMERYTFPDPTVAETLQRFTLLKIDMTGFNDEHRRVLDRFGLIGPPAYLFFGGGEELESFRLFGFVAAAPFTEHLVRIEDAVQ